MQTIPKTIQASQASGGSQSDTFDSVTSTKTILVCEDESGVRKFVAFVLNAEGYRVLEAANGDDALRALVNFSDPVDLLLTDIVMPKLEGRELAKRVRAIQPMAKLLFMSGFLEQSMLTRGVLDTNSNFLQKPFSSDRLTRKVRELLDAE